MKKFKEMIEESITKKTAKKHGRSFETQVYRDRLARKLKDGKKQGKSEEELAVILGQEQGTLEYAEMLISCGRLLDDKLANKLIDSGHWKWVKQHLSKFKTLKEQTIHRIEFIEEKERQERERLEKERERERKKLEKERERIGRVLYRKSCSCDLSSLVVLGEFGGKGLVKLKDSSGKWLVIRGDEICGFGYVSISEIKEIGGKPCFKGERKTYRNRDLKTSFIQGTVYDVVRGTSTCAYGCIEVGDIVEDSGKPIFFAERRDGRSQIMSREPLKYMAIGIHDCLFRGNECFFSFEKDSGGYNELYQIGIVGGLPVYQRKYPAYSGSYYELFWGHKMRSSEWRDIYSIKDDGGNLVVSGSTIYGKQVRTYIKH